MIFLAKYRLQSSRDLSLGEDLRIAPPGQKHDMVLFQYILKMYVVGFIALMLHN